MFPIISKGIGLGLLLSISVGPVFFTLIQTSLRKGFWAGLCFALGVSLSDLLCIVFAGFSIAQVSEDSWFSRNLSLLGGLVFIGFGIASMVRKIEIAQTGEGKMRKRSYVAQTLKGFTINIINPSVLLFWIGVVGLASVEYENSQQLISLFFGSILVTVFSLDLMKVYLSDQLRNFVTVSLLRKVYIVVGIVMIGFGIKLLFF